MLDILLIQSKGNTQRGYRFKDPCKKNMVYKLEEKLGKYEIIGKMISRENIIMCQGISNSRKAYWEVLIE